MIQVQTNAREVAEAFREIMRLTPRVAGQVIASVGATLRADVQNSIRGKGPISIAPRGALSKQIRKGTQGGRIPSGIRYRKHGNGVTVGATDWAAPYFDKFQSAELRDFTQREADRIVRAVRPNTGYVSEGMRLKYVPGQYARPARAIIQPMADSPRLAARIRDAATKRLAGMARAAAKKVRR